MGQTNNALFDLAINRANKFVLRAGPEKLSEWHTRTRFAVRVPLAKIIAALEKKPQGDCVWVGGENGGWKQV